MAVFTLQSAQLGQYLTNWRGLTMDIILLTDSPSDLPSKSINAIEQLKKIKKITQWLCSMFSMRRLLVNRL